MASVTPLPDLAQAEKFRLEVINRLARKRLTITDFAKSVGRARKTVSVAINHPTMGHPTKVLIAQTLGIKL